MKQFFQTFKILSLECGCSVKFCNTRIAVSVFAFLAVFVLGSCRPVSTQYKYVDTAMGTVIQLNLYADEKKSADAASEEIRELLKKLEQEQLSRRLETSEIYRINASAGNGGEWALSEDLGEILIRCREMWESSQGAFDITLGELVKLWQIDAGASGEAEQKDFQLPTAAEIEAALQNCGSEGLMLSGSNPVSIVLASGLQLDLGAVGKGVALDHIQNYLTSTADLSGAVISAGGSILVYGAKPDNSNWRVGIVNPLDTAGTIGTLSLDETGWFVTTSGDYERYVEVDGIRYHHIIDPSTGYPVRNRVKGVTLLTKDGLLGDMLSTACFVMGVEEGLQLAAEYHAEILFVLSDGEIVMSDGMKKYFAP